MEKLADLFTFRTKATDAAGASKKLVELYYHRNAVISPMKFRRPDILPIVVVLSGFGASGKGAFVEACREYLGGHVRELSTVYPAVDKAVEILIQGRNEMCPEYFKETPLTAEEHKARKTELWRTLMHRVKMAWEGFEDGPNVAMLTQVIHACTEEMSYVDYPILLFATIREANNTARFLEAVHDLGLLGITMLVDGRVAESHFLEDQTVMDYDYDIVISNNGSLEDLQDEANRFCASMVAGNLAHVGVPV